MNAARAFDPREIRARLDTQKVRTLLDRGYPLDLVKATLEERLLTKGDDFASLTEFVHTLEERKSRHQMLHDITNKQVSCQSVGTAPSQARNQSQLVKLNVPAQQSAPPELAKQNAVSSSALAAAAAASESTQAITQMPTKDNLKSVKMFNNDDLQRARQRNEELKEARQCKLCLDGEINVVFLPCGHACSCVSCAGAVTHCPICRLYIRGTVKIALD